MNTSLCPNHKAIVLLSLVLLLVSGLATRGQNLDKLIPGLYGGNGIILPLKPGVPFSQFHIAHFQAASASALDQLNNQLSRGFSQFPFNSSAGSFAFTFDRDLGTLVNTSETLGPLFAERAATIGSGKWSLSFYGTFFNYDTFNGQDLSNIHVPAFHGPVAANLETNAWFHDTLDIAVNTKASVNIFSPTVTYGVSDKLDISLLLPIVTVDMNVSSTYQLVIAPNQNPATDPHSSVPGSDSKSGSDTGIGDMVLEAKYRFYESGPVDLAAALLGQFATGDPNNFTGTGDNFLRPFLIASHTFREIGGSPVSLSPHVNLGYQADVNHSDFSSLEYAVGFDVGTGRVGMATDLLGKHYNQGDDRLDYAVGLRWNVWKRLVLSGNVILPLNDTGVRSDFITTFGIGTTF
jgi:Putative MetA-pathway of phenol degradation